MENGESLSDQRKEAKLRENCQQYGVNYIDPSVSIEEKSTRWKKMEDAIRREKNKQLRKAESDDQKKLRKIRDRLRKAQRIEIETPEQNKQRLESNAASEQRRVENLSPEKKSKRLKSKAVSEKERRANKEECSKKSSPRTCQTRLTMQEQLM